MGVEARFYVAEFTKRSYQQGHSTVILQASTRGPENKTWAKATPSGRIELTINNPDASAWFEARLGKDLTLEFGDPAELQCAICGLTIVDIETTGGTAFGALEWAGLKDGDSYHTACIEQARNHRG